MFPHTCILENKLLIEFDIGNSYRFNFVLCSSYHCPPPPLFLSPALVVVAVLSVSLDFIAYNNQRVHVRHLVKFHGGGCVCLCVSRISDGDAAIKSKYSCFLSVECLCIRMIK